MTKATEAYSLTCYNYYFFSWMIVTGIARHTVEWDSLARENIQWDALVVTVMKGFSQDQADTSPLAATKSAITGVFGNKNKANPSVLTPFVGSAYLCSTLEEALIMTREQIRKSLAEIIIQSAVGKAMHEVSDISAQKAGNKAARDYAAKAASDAAMQAVIETMWQDLVSSEDGGSLWESRCKLATWCVEAASTAAADAMGNSQRPTIAPGDATGQTQPTTQTPAHTPALAQVVEPTPLAPVADGAPAPAPPARWETAWEGTWETTWEGAWRWCWVKGANPRGETKTAISNRAKVAWAKAWDDALKANEQYVPLLSKGLVEYVTHHLPEAHPGVLKYETDTSMATKIVKGLTSTTLEGSTNAKLQEWVKDRITSHCQHVFRMTAGAQKPSRQEFEETMREFPHPTAAIDPKSVKNQSTAQVVPNSYIIGLSPNNHVKRGFSSAHEELYHDLRRNGADWDVIRGFSDPLLTGAAVKLNNPSDLVKLAQANGVESITPNYLHPPPKPVSQQSMKDNDGVAPVDVFSTHIMTGVHKLHAEGYLGKGITIGIIDTGVDYTHPALGGKFGPGNKIIGGYDFVDDAFTGLD
ncbi:unnamed protein product, partial [Rhizoctonia solani]